MDPIGPIREKDEQQKKPKTFFQKLAFILLDNTRKTEVAKEIIEDGKFGKVYRLQIILSVIICTLGLLINSVPVIIGAMLIAPILTPIKIIAFAITTGNRYLYKKGLKVSALSILFAISIAMIITKITPISTLTPEIYARVSPTIIDLCIALASGVIAFISLGFKRIWEGIAGVAMATALVPPLCVVGIGITFLNIEIAKGSFLLFITNFFAIILVGIVIFYAFGFFPTNEKGKKRSMQSIILTIITIVVISIPLTNSMKSMANDMKTRQTIENRTNEFLENINKEIIVEKISYQIQENNILRISTTIAVPSLTPITEKNKSDLSQILAISTQKSVNLDLHIVNISSVSIDKKDDTIANEKLQEKIQKYIQEYTGISIIELKITYNPLPLVYINLFSKEIQIKEKIQSDIEALSKETLGESVNVLVLWQQKEDKEEKQKEIVYYKEIENFIKGESENIFYIDSFKIERQSIGTRETLTIKTDIRSSLDDEEIRLLIEIIKQKLESNYKENFIFEIHTIAISEMVVK